ncbi:hypothetical protein ACGFIF_42850 [Kribbella sp. NPDC049174]|uniref:hypothetical protein n=1 Tax=Kribbella sp. NPDC049174 TaxID=3364112 RepID=UPI003718DE9C
MTELEVTDPNWGPLEMHLPPEKCGDWMWMSRVRTGRRVIEQYKHRETRSYVCLDHNGKAWRLRRTWPAGRERYVRANAAAEIAAASAGW